MIRSPECSVTSVHPPHTLWPSSLQHRLSPSESGWSWMWEPQGQAFRAKLTVHSMEKRGNVISTSTVLCQETHSGWCLGTVSSSGLRSQTGENRSRTGRCQVTRSGPVGRSRDSTAKGHLEVTVQRRKGDPASETRAQTRVLRRPGLQEILDAFFSRNGQRAGLCTKWRPGRYREEAAWIAPALT